MRHRPLLMWSAAFAAGIGLGALGWLTPVLALCLAVPGTAALAARRRPALFPIALLLLGLSAGSLRLAVLQTVSPKDVSHLADQPGPITLFGTIASDPETRPGGRVTFFLNADRAEKRGCTAAVTGEVSVGLAADAARGAALDYGDAVQLDGLLETPPGATNPGAFSWRDYLARRVVYCQMNVKRPGTALVLNTPGVFCNPFLSLAWQVRKSALHALQQSLSSADAAVLSGILIGRRTDLPPGLMADFVHTGTVHILASAGLHVGILAFWLERLFLKLSLPRKLAALLLIGCLLLFALVCGGRPAVVRAVLMAGLYFGAILVEREPDGPTAISAAALLILLIQPTALLEPGFQMSFLTIGTLALTLPVWNGFWRPKLIGIFHRPLLQKTALWIVEAAGVSLLAQLGAMPVVALSYSEVSLTGWLANLLVVPLLFVLVPIGLLGITLWCLWNPLGAALLTAAGWGVEIILRVVRGLGESPWAYLALPPPPLPLILAFYALVYGGTDAAQKLLGTQKKTLGTGPVAPASAAPDAAPAGASGLVGSVPPP